MAQDTAAEKAKSDVDIDNIEVEILILAKDAAKLKSTAAFLSRRGWPTTVVSDVQKAIAQISEKAPDFVMVSLDHPSPAFAKLPDLLVRSFGVECIGFVEGAGSSSAQKLNHSRLRHKISGLASGPNCQRSIRRILAEKFDVKTDERTSDEASNDGAGSVTVRGGSAAAAAADGSGYEPGTVHSAPATNMIKGERLGEVPSESEVVSNGKYSFAQAGNRKSLRELMGHKEAAPTDAKAKAQELLASLGPVGDLESADEKNESSASGSMSPGTPSMSSQLESSAAADHSGGSSHAPQIPGSMVLPSPAATKAQEATAAANAASSAIEFATAPAPVNGKVVSLLEVAVKEAMDTFASSGPSEGTPLTLHSTGRVAVYPLDSVQYPGYIVIAMQYSDLIDEKHVIDSCHGELAESFRRNSVPAKVESGFAVDLPFVNFKEWATQNAVFSMNPIYYSYEFGVAFFQAAAALPKAEPMEESNMFGIDVKAISTEEPVNFKAYLHLRKNQKYFLYLRSGRKFQPEQKDRLIGNNVGNLYMKSVDVENLRVYLAGNYLRNSMKKKSS